MVPLRFPDYFPPKDRWGKFFIGVRWLGPDLSFFKELKKQQAARTPDCMNVWRGERQEAIARLISRVLSEQLGWEAPFFIPEDSAEVVFHGPRFDFIDPEAAFDAVIEALAHDLGVKPSKEFWQEQVGVSMGQLVSRLQAESAA